MADFTTGVIDLSIANTFDNVAMGSGDTMTFSNAGTGGATGEPILVTGDFTAIGATITLRNNTNLTPGTVSVVGISRDLDAAAAVPGTPGSGGNGPSLAGSGGYGGAAGGNGEDGEDGYAVNPPTLPPQGGTGGAHPTGTGGAGTPGISSSGFPQGYASGGGGGGGGTSGLSTESVSFYVQGNINITGGTITGVGTAATANGGIGGRGGDDGSYDYAAGGGGGGAGGGGGNGGNLYLYHIGSATDSSTKTLTGGAPSAGGVGGAGGVGFSGDGDDGAAGTSGSAGATGVVELINVDTVPLVAGATVSRIFSTQADVAVIVENDGGTAITERGFVYAKTTNPTTADTKIVVPGTLGEMEATMESLDEDDTYYVRAFATNAKGTAYGDEAEFKTLKNFIPQITTGN